MKYQMPPPPPPIVNEQDAPTYTIVNEQAPYVQKPTAPRPKTFNEEVSLIFNKTLTPIHAKDPIIMAFILSYVNCRHVGQASKDVGITSVEGRNLIKYRDIDECVRKVSQLSAIKYGYNVDDMVERAKEITDLDITDIYREDGTFKHPKDWPSEMRRVVKKLEVRNIMEKDPNGMETGRMIGEVIKVEFHDKIEPIKLLAQEKEVFKKQTTVTHDISKNMGSILLGLKSAEDRALTYVRDVTEGEDGERD